MAGTGAGGFRNGIGIVAEFNVATGLAIDSNRTVYVADAGNHSIRGIWTDSGGVGIPDQWQRAHFGVTGIDPSADPDNDGMSNLDEFNAGTDPNDPNSVLRITSITPQIDGVLLSWSRGPNDLIYLESTEGWETNTGWQTISTNAPTASSDSWYLDSYGTGAPRFYRVRVGGR